MSSRIKKIYQLRKGGTNAVPATTIKPVQTTGEQADDKQLDSPILNQSKIDKPIFEEPLETQMLSSHPMLQVQNTSLLFVTKINTIKMHKVKVRNIGSTAIYYQWVLKNQNKINSSAIKDLKPKFFCHHKANVIKPKEQKIIVFSFYSQIPGVFLQQCQLICKPNLAKPVPTIKLQGKAFIQDALFQSRQDFYRKMEIQCDVIQVKQYFDDLLNTLKVPQPPPPNVDDPLIAEREFQVKNVHLNLYYQPKIHPWFLQLLEDIWNKCNVVKEQRYWDQSILYIQKLIESAPVDEIDRKCYLDRLKHYTHLCTFKPAAKSYNYKPIKELLIHAGFKLGGDLIDATRKQLQMWEIPFQQPSMETSSQQFKKARKDQLDKIKAEWLKKAKKKKWGQEDEQNLIKEYRSKLQGRVTTEILDSFDGYEQKTVLVELEKKLEDISKTNFKQYLRRLKKLKTVKQSNLTGKKVLIKMNLRLRPNSQNKLNQLKQYLIKKKQQQAKREEERKDADANKKKKQPKGKKKPEQEEKPLNFDFNALLQPQNWQGFVNTFRIVSQKQPFMILLAFTWGPRLGIQLEQYSLSFLLEHVRTLQPTIQFLGTNEFYSLNQKLVSEAISEGSIFLVQNLNFVPGQVMQQTIIIPATQEQPQQLSSSKLLFPEIIRSLQPFQNVVDLIVDGDCFQQNSSGFVNYLEKQNVLSSLWWKYVGLSTRVPTAKIVLSHQIPISDLYLLPVLLINAGSIYLTSINAFKFQMTLSNITQFANITLSPIQKQTYSKITKWATQNQMLSKLILPLDWNLYSEQNEQIRCLNINDLNKTNEANYMNWKLASIASQSIKQIKGVESGHLMFIGDPCFSQRSSILKEVLIWLKGIKQHKKIRHAQQAHTPQGINYDDDFVIYLIGIQQQKIINTDLRQKKVKIKAQKSQVQQEQEQFQEQEQQQEQEDEQEGSKIDKVCDFMLGSSQCFLTWVSPFFHRGLKNISSHSD